MSFDWIQVGSRDQTIFNGKFYFPPLAHAKYVVTLIPCSEKNTRVFRSPAYRWRDRRHINLQL